MDKKELTRQLQAFQNSAVWKLFLEEATNQKKGALIKAKANAREHSSPDYWLGAMEAWETLETLPEKLIDRFDRQEREE